LIDISLERLISEFDGFETPVSACKAGFCVSGIEVVLSGGRVDSRTSKTRAKGGPQGWYEVNNKGDEEERENRSVNGKIEVDSQVAENIMP